MMPEPKVEYFVIQDLGYDGLVMNKFNTFDEAKKLYDDAIKQEENFKLKFPVFEPNYPIMLIKGQVLMEVKGE